MSESFLDRISFTAGLPVMGAVGEAVAGGAVVAGGGKFSVDPEHAQQLIDDLRAVLKELAAINEQARRLATVDPPAEDPHSRRAAQEISKVAVGKDGCHYEANLAYQKAIKATIASLEASLKAYREAEQANIMRQRG
ncbi:PE family protein [Streptoalloteichus tenebrarius]|uniref:PE family protein n=1 Tax=Streptoalloteichus tenebrarius (strain ATCC 17920 / DSM 40477 / JCM 4838 / CBS 697.72 / NBRC 16177 / NCIMB 11028 / NRRL B-12390 / A12253. 1 / ISP 5477) TaxID=1933 RepID=A0ABT1HNF1_STRSD|nr:hypothetical protein [Streptoalloteichus tenebrarius]MCP2257041.1 PE family protein [Streptoalloteichus tenebrarius]BFF00049.1 hypothetical protein GCM10020241_17240 [Streptoalloteichus tenebrarius]